MDSNLKLALRDALMREYAWTSEIDPAELNHQFSPEFETKMREHIDFDRNERRYVHIGHRRIRRALLVAVVAVMLLGLVACAVVLTKPSVTWNETQNDTSGTLDITFDVEYPEGTEIPTEFEPVKPKKPWGYKIVKELQHANLGYEITYNDSKGNTIYYLQWAVENSSFGLDNEDAEFYEVTINGHKGYAYSKLGNNALTWSDGIYLYDIIGTADMETIEKMAQSIS